MLSLPFRLAVPPWLVLLLGCSSAVIAEQENLTLAPLAEIQQRANQGTAEAQFSLGLAFATGNGVRQDDVQAVAWFRRAAGQGHPAAQYYLGFAYANGRGVPHDNAQAAVWYRQAARQGHAAAREEYDQIRQDLRRQSSPGR